MRRLTIFLSLIIFLFSNAANAYRDEKVTIPNNNETIDLHIWFPDDAIARTKNQSLPLIIISHGTGGSSDGHVDTAQALANAGFVVAALTHPGDNYRDNSYVGLGKNLSSRPPHVSRVIDYMLTTWPTHQPIDPARIGVFGFSAGGFTALALAGGRPNFDLTAEHCRSKPDAWDCNYLRENGAPKTSAPFPADVADIRIKAAVVAAPAVGYAFEPNGLANVHIPIQLWSGQNDTIVDDSGEVVRRLLPTPPEYHFVAKATHFSFMQPCDWKLRSIITVMHWFGTPDICTESEGFDRFRFHDEFNRSVVQFFSAQLPEKSRSK